jgi:DNA adenine methylase
MTKIEVPRFVKWAGGKLQLINQFESIYPKKIERYFEPFVGSGAVAFYIIQKYNPSEVFISDINKELITTYNVVKNNVEELISLLKEHKKNHELKEKEYYLEMRGKNINTLSMTEIAARFIYLNRTCFNGLYRVNSKGGFNVPMGKYTNPDIVQKEKLEFISKLLANAYARVMPFEKILNLAKKEDFIYFDPPYYPLKKESFTTYTKYNFLEEKQKDLAEIFNKLTEKGCYCMESNSDTEFIRQLYSKYSIDVVKARRVINSKANGRGKINELVIRNY